MDDADAKRLLDRLDGSGSPDEWAAAKELRGLGADFATWLLTKFRAERSIGSGNYHYAIDRDHTGMMKLDID
jgi:hypothetical protein